MSAARLTSIMKDGSLLILGRLQWCDLSRHLCKVGSPPPAPPPDANPAKFEQGHAAAQKHRCGFCHNPDLSGHDQIGRIGDQREDYLLKALRGYKSGERVGYDPAMNEVAQEISDEEIGAIAHYVAHFR
jgi:cytochrome c553